MLKVTRLVKTFDPGTLNEVRALRDVSLEIPEGSVTLVLGGNGSGKTTLLNAVAGAFVPDSGRIELGGCDVTAWPDYRRARWIGRVFQNPFLGTAPNLSVAENLALAAERGRPRGLRRALRRSRYREIRERVRALGLGLEDRLEQDMGSLSGGQRQALTLLMATWVRPRLLLLDEHTAALDPKSADQVIRLTADLVARERLTTLMVTHSMAQAAALGDRLIMMHQGEIAHDFSGADKRRLRVEDLLGLFDDLRRSDRLDTAAADLLRRRYV